MTKLSFVHSPSLVQQKCQLPTPHKFGSRVPSLLMEIEISRLAIMKKWQNWVLCIPRRSYSKSVNYRPPISLGQGFHHCWPKSKFPKGSIIVDGNRNFPLGHYEKWQNWVLCVPRRLYSKSVNYRPPISFGQGFHPCWRKSKFLARPLWKMTKLGFMHSPSLVQQKCQLPTPHKFGSRVPLLLTELKICLRPLWIITKLDFVHSLLVLEQ